MNYKIHKMSISLLFVFLIFSSIAIAIELPMQIELVRSFNIADKTSFDINFYIPYNSLEFEKRENYFVSVVDLDITFTKADSIFYNTTNTFHIAVSNEFDTQLSDKGYLDKLNYTFKGDDVGLRLVFTEPSTTSEFEWETELIALAKDALVGDIEISSKVIPAKSDYLKKFQREGFIYKVEPSHIIDLQTTEHAYLSIDTKPDFDLTSSKLEIYRKDELVKSLKLKEDSSGAFPIKLNKFDNGFYEIVIKDTENNMLANSYLVIKRIKRDIYTVTEKLEDEYVLIKYFGNNNETSRWHRLNSPDAKKRFATKFWTQKAIENRMEIEDYISFLRKRVADSSKYDYKFKRGWLTDRGRIYILHGEPDEIIIGQTTAEGTYLVKKDYEIWKYESKNRPSYLFLDMQMNKNYRIVHVLNDENESSDPKWKEYMGSDFDVSDME